jgi:glutamate synthase domain-containing protein 2
MPLLKKSPETIIEEAIKTKASVEQKNKVEHPSTKSTKTAVEKGKTPLTKEGYWDRKEERDIQRDKDMAWSGLAQAALSSVGVIQLNADNTEDGLVSLVVRITDKLLKARDNHNQ